MALYALGDLHLSIATGRDMNRFGDIWIDHEKKIKDNFEKYITDEDTVVLTGDHSWGGHLSTCRPDLEWIANLPGRKILLRGNHDVFWNVKKTRALNKEFEGRLLFLQDNYFVYGDYALIGSKGYCYEATERTPDALLRAPKRYEREYNRLKKSFKKAAEDGHKNYIMFLHYPPFETDLSGCEWSGKDDSCFARLAKEYGVKEIIYSHVHGKENHKMCFQGEKDGIIYRMVSSDYVDFVPQLILK